jgi:hypothetical protein
MPKQLFIIFIRDSDNIIFHLWGKDEHNQYREEIDQLTKAKKIFWSGLYNLSELMMCTGKEVIT